MFVEAELPMLMLIGFIAVMVVYAALIFKFVGKAAKDGAWLFVVQIVLLAIAFSQLYMMLGREHTAMISEQNSLNLAIAGLCWALSMVALALGIKKVSEEQE